MVEKGQDALDSFLQSLAGCHRGKECLGSIVIQVPDLEA